MIASHPARSMWNSQSVVRSVQGALPPSGTLNVAVETDHELTRRQRLGTPARVPRRPFAYLNTLHGGPSASTGPVPRRFFACHPACRPSSRGGCRRTRRGSCPAAAFRVGEPGFLRSGSGTIRAERRGGERWAFLAAGVGNGVGGRAAPAEFSSRVSTSGGWFRRRQDAPAGVGVAPAETPKAYGTFVEYTHLVGALCFNGTVEALVGPDRWCIDEFELGRPRHTVLMSSLLMALTEGSAAGRDLKHAAWDALERDGSRLTTSFARSGPVGALRRDPHRRCGLSPPRGVPSLHRSRGAKTRSSGRYRPDRARPRRLRDREYGHLAAIHPSEVLEARRQYPAGRFDRGPSAHRAGCGPATCRADRPPIRPGRAGCGVRGIRGLGIFAP